MIGIIGGTHILDSEIFSEMKKLDVKTPYGNAEANIGYIGGIKVVVIQRHGKEKNKPPHRINHSANFYAFKSMGVNYVIGMSSVGSLRDDISIPAIIIPDDYIDFFSGVTIYNDRLVHVTPGFDAYLRDVLIKFAKKKSKFPVLERGVYFQTRGPRLETRAEIRMIKNFADCVGMTAGSEATIAKELGLRYATICTMDNYAHGIKGASVDYEEIVRKAKQNAEICLDIVGSAVKFIWEDELNF